MRLTDWLGNEYGVDSRVVYCENYGNNGSRMLEGYVVDITEKGTPIIDVFQASRGGVGSRDKRRVCRIPQNITVLES